jgi:predicted dehydrogenase
MINTCLVIGLGQIGMGYDLAHDPSKAIYSHARAFSLHPAFTLLGAIDPCATQRALFEQHYQRPAYADLAHAPAADVVVIAVPTTAHYQVLITVLAKFSPKVIVCEKPLAYSLAEANGMIEACEAAGVTLLVNYMRRADPGVIEIKRRLELTLIATPVKGCVWYSKGFLHNGSHFFNLLEFWLGACVKTKILDAGRSLTTHDAEPDVYVEFERGHVVFMAAWEEVYSHYTIELLSPSGRLSYEQGGELITWQSTQANANFPCAKKLQTVKEELANGMSHYQWHVANQLVNVLADQPHYLCTGRQALTSLAAMQHIIQQR